MQKEQLLKIHSTGMNMEHFTIMDLILKDKDLWEVWLISKFRAYREALIRKGMVVEVNNEYFLTEKGEAMYNACKVNTVQETIPEPLPDTNPIKTIAQEILRDVKIRIKEKTGKERMLLKSGSPYLPSERELVDRLIKFGQKFKNSKYDLVKSAIIEYTSDILDGKINFPRKLVYFIFKEDDKKGLISDMVGYMESLGEKSENKVEDTRKLF